ncbi:MAG TPA: hypothetical protein P5267_01640, partial [Patescibacteria group bacterium]|nr:hypothetical protein [Patescibacteria group bacterium]
TKRMSDINQLRSALQLYSMEKMTYPDGDVIALGVPERATLDSRGWAPSPPTAPVYMPIVPRDPKQVNLPDNPCKDNADSPCDYSYTFFSADSYVIYFYLEDDLNNMAAGLHRATKDNIY